MTSIELELEALNAVGLCQLAPSHLLNYFKEELTDRILASLVSDMDNLIQTIDANNSFKILSLNDHNNCATDNNNLNDSHNSSLSSSLSETTLNSCKSLLADISNKLNQIFAKYNGELSQLIELFERQPKPQMFASRQELLEYQRAILVQRLSTKHYDLLSLLFRNVFDYYQKSNQQVDEDDEELNETATDSEPHSLNREHGKDMLIENFEAINRTM